jgi:hypothetical protein
MRTWASVEGASVEGVAVEGVAVEGASVEGGQRGGRPARREAGVEGGQWGRESGPRARQPFPRTPSAARMRVRAGKRRPKCVLGAPGLAAYFPCMRLESAQMRVWRMSAA